MTNAPSDIRWMRLALSLGRRGLGRVWPNPSVGCVIVKDSRVIGRGWTQDGGRPHAEVMALTQAGKDAEGSTVYVTLEPCSHHGETPPCAEALVAANVARVVVATGDPNPKVNGKGIALVEDAGITVETGICAADADHDLAGFLTRIKQSRPMLTLKLASSLDGRIATASGDSQWITGPDARAFTHHLRATNDAILVGSETARADDPDLQTRLRGRAAQSPVRVVLDRTGTLPPSAKLFTAPAHAEVWRIHDESLTPPPSPAAHVINIPCPVSDERIDMTALMRALGERGITRVLCEGGGKLAASLIQADLVDRLVVFHAGLLLGADGRPAMGDLGLDKLSEAEQFTLTDCRQVGADTISTWQRARGS